MKINNSKKRNERYMETPREIQSTIMIAFTVVSIIIILVLSVVMYQQFADFSRENTIKNTERLIQQSSENLEEYLMSMRRISDTAYYNAIKESDFSTQAQDVQVKLNLLYEANKENLRSIVLYNNYGSLIMAEPLATQKEDPNATKQDWYIQAMKKVENMHFSTPHIQNLFDDGTKRYYWVISLSRMVEITNQGVSQSGVLLVDMDYSSISQLMDQMNTASNGQYYYLCDRNGEIVYHPRQIQISNGIGQENSNDVAGYKDGVYDDTLDGVGRKVVVNTISYTGWKLVGVIPYSAFTAGMINMFYFVVLLMLLMIMMLVVVNRIVSLRISSPIMKLNESVAEYEAGKKPDIYIGGSSEIIHLGHSIQQSYEQIDILMKKILWEQNERRKSELAALQSQINPHFLYNTLDSIMWMVESGRNEDASFMISQLAKLLRISLSKGRTVISIKDELQHAQSYMNIQKVRYKNAFSIEFDIDPEVNDYCTVKLILQPILENAINYGIDPMDDCGEIKVCGRLVNNEIVLSVSDNGMGIPENQIDQLLTNVSHVQKKGSGIGLVNVNNRIQILFGKSYGIKIESELDEGTTMSIHLPAVLYTEENRQNLELGNLPGNNSRNQEDEA